MKSHTKILPTVYYPTPFRLTHWHIANQSSTPTYKTTTWVQYGVRAAAVRLTCDNMKGTATYTYTPVREVWRNKTNSQYCYHLSCQFFPGTITSWKG